LSSGEEQFVKIEGYTLASCYCRSTQKHGGSCIYISEGIACKELLELKTMSIESVLECSAVELLHPKILVLSIYRPGSGNIKIFIDALIDILDYSS